MLARFCLLVGLALIYHGDTSVFGAEINAEKTATDLIESKKKAIRIFNQYLDIIHARYVDEKGKFDPSIPLKERDIKNINTLSTQYFGLTPLNSDSAAGKADATIKAGVKQLTAIVNNRKIASEDEEYKYHEIHVQGEEDPKQLHKGILTRISGQVELLTHPADKILHEDPNQKYAKFDGKYYSYKLAKPLDQIESGDIVRIGSVNNSKARLVFNNGDHIDLGSATAFRMFWSNTGIDKTAAADLLYGRIRLVVKKGGPRKNLHVNTHTAVMGVRGTDFYLNDNSENTRVVVMRGNVNVKPKNDKLAPIDVKAGFMASFPTTKDSPPIQEIEIKDFSQKELDQLGTLVHTMEEKNKKIRSNAVATFGRADNSDFLAVQEISRQIEVAYQKNNPSTEGSTFVEPKTLEEKLETKAFFMVLQDVLNEDPDIIPKLKANHIHTVDELDAFVIENLKHKNQEAVSDSK